MEEPPPSTPQKRHQNLEKEVTIKLIPPIPLIQKTKIPLSNNPTLKVFLPKISPTLPDGGL